MNPAARWLIGGAAIHRLAETSYDLVMPLVVLSLTGSPVLMGLMFAVGFVAEFIVAVIGGSIVDLVSRKRLLLLITGAEVLVMAACGALALTGSLGTVALIAAAALIDFLVRLYLVADTAALPRVVDRQTLPRANGLMQVFVSIAQAVGPMLAGWVVGLSDVGGALLVTSGVFLLLFVSLSQIPSWGIADPAHDSATQNDVLRHMWEGVRFTFGNPLYRQIAIWRGFFDFFIGAAFLMFIFYMREELDFSGMEIGIATTMGAVGAIGGGLVFAKVQARFPSHTLITLLCAGMGVAFGVMAAAGQTWSVGLLMMSLMFLLSLLGRLLTLLFQDTVPANLLGRVTATSQLLTTGFGPLSVLSAAWLSDVASARHVFVIVAVAVLALAVLSRFGVMSRADWRIRLP
ncbi:MFS transporter [Spongiactinospora sp. 9N601]|uniref:MFS transporter n=1 Tax=Spongiactinospora sp. 9N601 TaxID=3375149 RepID=UPI0037950D26